MTFFKNIWANLKKYSFLLKELVARDFKVKYKRSVLGILWSVLNPLLMMIVMSIVFSQMFKFSVPGVNYLVYLLIGLVMFNYFSEATNSAMGSVVGNFSLINKVYIPKYIFPLSKCLFVGINFLLTLIPLYLMIFFTGTGETKVIVTWLHVFLPYVFICLFLFSLGIGFILATISVFLRDMFYIYSVIITILTYMTPIMYDLAIIDSKLQILFKCNPLYQFIDFARTIILYGQIPSATSFITCGLLGIGTCLIGALIFKAKQDKFIYYV